MLISRVRFKLKQLLVPSNCPVFIHVPKTGGTYLGQMESSGSTVLRPVRHLGHCIVADSGVSLSNGFPPVGLNPASLTPRRKLDGKTVFSTVRNPFDFFVSYAAHAGGWNPKYRDPDHYDYEAANKGLDYLLKTIADREDTWPSRKFLFFQLFSTGGDFLPNWVCRTETLDDDLYVMAKKLGLKYSKAPKQRVGGIGDYRKHYNDELVELVNKTWARELALYGYSFEGEPLSPLVGLEVSPAVSEQLKYSFMRDELVLPKV